ncbi:hypothetical protein IC762_17800 [Bradyrhizobium genosp. L]|nr:hypothetical protein [Bradyrhizobium genosp. L]QPF88425.1 hypothetical protein IC762_17800 [Bradyrhizobium genosp. L]
MISARLATLHELQTVYGTEDLEDMLEIVQVDAENARIASRWSARQAKA